MPISVWLLLLLLFSTENRVCASSKELRTIELTDPVYPNKPKWEHDLILHLDDQNFPSGYSMQLVNSVCLDGVCKLVEVTLYWDAVGFYQRLEYPENKPLTKVEHDPFTAADYEKLDSILKDRQSILDDYSLGFLATEDSDTTSDEENEVDGVSKATPGEVKEAVVKDAAWTTWVLWKYANTEIFTILQAMTESRCSPQYLEHLLKSQDWRKIEFAINYLLKQEPVSNQYLDQVAALLPSAGRDHIELAIAFIEQASPNQNTCYRKLISALGGMDGYNAGLVIKRLESDEQLEEEILEALASSLEQQDYYPTHLALRLIESRKFFSREVEADIVKLLQSKDFFIARRASEFLSRHTLSSTSEGKLRAFKETHAMRL
jgi:hypothetical protein